jgi:hypothetical protein
LSKIDDKTREFLLLQPESGMGYQLVQKKDDGDRLLVLNAELSVRVAELHELVVDQDDHGSFVTVDSDLPRLRIDPQNVLVITHGSYRATSRKGEVFVRYSAFKNDRRIRPDGSVVSGTYVTTENDACHWGPPFGWTGLSVVGRYALPNRNPAIHLFLMRPSQSVPISCGCVTPNYGQAGGGVEIRFERNTPPNTVIRTDVIPDR